jgi:hypothetical protein
MDGKEFADRVTELDNGRFTCCSASQVLVFHLLPARPSLEEISLHEYLFKPVVYLNFVLSPVRSRGKVVQENPEVDTVAESKAQLQSDLQIRCVYNLLPVPEAEHDIECLQAKGVL